MIRHATSKDAPAIAMLFHDTVKKINSRDYSETQVRAWAGLAPDPGKWTARQSSRLTFVDEEDGIIRGFAELEEEGHIGSLYVHAEFQGEGIASSLLQRVEEEAIARGADYLWTEASITAKLFFAKHGFEVITAQEVEYQGAVFRNYRMQKDLTNR
jgi:putative acetyltransferase